MAFATTGGTAPPCFWLKPIMPSDPEEPSALGPEASEALHQFRDGIARARLIVREAKQAIGQAVPEGAVLPTDPGPEDEPDPRPDGPVIPAG